MAILPEGSLNSFRKEKSNDCLREAYPEQTGFAKVGFVFGERVRGSPRDWVQLGHVLRYKEYPQ